MQHKFLCVNLNGRSMENIENKPNNTHKPWFSFLSCLANWSLSQGTIYHLEKHEWEKNELLKYKCPGVDYSYHVQTNVTIIRVLFEALPYIVYIREL